MKDIKIIKNNQGYKVEEEKIKWLFSIISEKYSSAALNIVIKNIKNNNKSPKI